MNHTATSAPSRAALLLPLPSEFSSSYEKLGTECWRDVIVAGRSRKSSATFATQAIVLLREPAAVRLMSLARCRDYEARAPWLLPAPCQTLVAGCV